MTDIRLNLGSGGVATPGWVCIDRSPNIWLSRWPALKRLMRALRLLKEQHMAHWDRDVVRGDIRRLSFADGSVDAVYSSHTLEHLHLEEARQVLLEARRVLRSDGVIRLALPDATENARQLLVGEEAGDGSAGEHFNERLLAHPRARPSRVRAFIGRAGGHVHLWQPTPAMVKKMLHEAGFVHVAFCAYRDGNLPEVEVIETRPEGFHIEARTP